MEKLNLTEDLISRAKKIKLLLMDCDGVLTDGKLYFTEAGEIMKVFHVRDGQGLASWHKAGYRSGIISGRDAEKILRVRAIELGIHYIKASSFNKDEDLIDILKEANVTLEEVAYIGDDIGDICLLQKVGLPIVVADAASEVLPFAAYITKANGGFAAVRETIDFLLSVKKIN